MGMLRHLQPQRPADIFESVAKHSMSQIVHQCRRQRYMLLMIFRLVPIFYKVTFDDLHQVTSCMKHADTVGETRVGSPRINEFRETELLNSTQTLKRASLDNTPNNILELSCAKLD